MKKIVKALGGLLLLVLIMAGCSTQSTPKSTDSKGDLVVQGNDFSGSVQTDNNGQQNMSVHFDKGNKAVVTMTSFSKADGRWTKQITSGNYAFADKKRVEITCNEAMSEGFASKKAMQDNETPTKMVNLPVKGSNYEFTLKKNALRFSKDNIYPSKAAGVTDYAEYVNHDQKDYDKKYAKLSGRSFMSPATDLLENGIAFKGDKFIWKYGGSSEYGSGLDQGGSLAIYTGMYKVEGNQVTLFRYKGTALYEGTIMNLSKNNYQNMVAANYLPDELTFKFSKNNKLHLLTHNKYLTVTDMLDYGTVSGTPNYNSWVKKYDIDKFEAQMQQKNVSDADTDSSTDSDTDSSKAIAVDPDADSNSDDSDSSSSITSADDFKQFLADQGIIDEDSDNEYTAKDGNGYDFPINGSDDTVTAKYQVFWDNLDGSLTHIIMLGNDGNIYEGNSGALMRIDDDATDAYHNLDD